MIGKTCNSCCFYSAHPHMSNRGQCRAMSPKVSFDKVEGITKPRTIWPNVRGVEDWCGQHATWSLEAELEAEIADANTSIRR